MTDTASRPPPEPKPSDIMTIGPLQTAIMITIWRRMDGEATVDAVAKDMNARRALANEPTLAYTTFLTVMRNLARRKILKQESQPGMRSHLFIALMSEQEYRDQLLDYIRINVFSGSGDDMRAEVTRRYPPSAS